MVKFSLSEIEEMLRNGEIETVPDAPEAEPMPPGFWDSAVVVAPYGQGPARVPVDKDIVAWFKTNGNGGVRQVNAILRDYVDAHKQPA